MSNFSRCYVNSAFGSYTRTGDAGAFSLQLPQTIQKFSDVELTQVTIPFCPIEPSIPLRNNTLYMVFGDSGAGSVLTGGGFPWVHSITIDTTKDYSNINDLVTALNTLTNAVLLTAGATSTNIWSVDMTTFRITAFMNVLTEYVILGNYQSDAPISTTGAPPTAVVVDEVSDDKTRGLLWRLGYDNSAVNANGLISTGVLHNIGNITGTGKFRFNATQTATGTFLASDWVKTAVAPSNWNILRTSCIYLCLGILQDGLTPVQRTDVISQIPIEDGIVFGDLVNKQISYDFSNSVNMTNSLQNIEIEVLDDMFEPFRLCPTNKVMIELHFDKQVAKEQVAKIRTGNFGIM